MKTRLIAVALLAVLIQAAKASDGTITFTGALQNATCTITGGGNLNVTLPTLSTATLATAGATGGDTLFNIALTGCSAGIATASAFFEAGANTDATTGRLNSTGTAGNVQIQLLNSTGSVVNVAAVTVAGQGTQAATITSNAGTQSFIARYYATGATTAGTVASSVTYLMVYN